MSEAPFAVTLTPETVKKLERRLDAMTGHDGKTMIMSVKTEKHVVTRSGDGPEPTTKAILKALALPVVKTSDADLFDGTEDQRPKSHADIYAEARLAPDCLGEPWDEDECKAQLSIDCVGALAESFLAPGERFILTLRRL
jgi:hypothetical protein